MRKFLRKLIVDDTGQDLIEYALIAALIGLGSVAAVRGLAMDVNNTLKRVGDAMTTASCGPGFSCANGH